MGSGAEYIIPAVISVVASAASTGVNMYSQQQAAENSERMAAYNAAIQRNNADLQTRMAQQQAAVEQQVAMAQYDAQQKNAAALANQADGIEAQGREKVRRLREEQERALAQQRARFAKAGVVNEGSPLVVLADTARLTELNVQDSAYETEMNRDEMLRKADLERYQAGYSLLDAGMAEYRSRAQEAQRRMAYRQADLGVIQGNVDAGMARMGVASSLISGFGSTAKQVYGYGNDLGWFKKADKAQGGASSVH